MKLGNKLTYEELLNMNGQEVYVKDVHNKLLGIPVQKCKVHVSIETPDEAFDWDELGYKQRWDEEDILDDYFRDHDEPIESVLLENSEYQYFYDDNGDCEDGEFIAYQIA